MTRSIRTAVESIVHRAMTAIRWNDCVGTSANEPVFGKPLQTGFRE